MKIITNAKALSETIQFGSAMTISAAEMAEKPRAKRNRETGEVISFKLDRHGNQTFSAAMTVIDTTQGRPLQQCYVSVREPFDMNAFEQMVPVGEIEINVFGDITTMVVDRFEPANKPAATKMNVGKSDNNGGGE